MLNKYSNKNYYENRLKHKKSNKSEISNNSLYLTGHMSSHCSKCGALLYITTTLIQCGRCGNFNYFGV